MKRPIFTLLVVLALAILGTALMAQTNPQTPNPNVPPSQQVDQSGQPEHAGRPDVDVDVGKNANNGVLNVDAKRNGDSDTKAGNNPNGNQMSTTTTGTATGTTTTTGAYSSDTTGTGTSADNARRMPRTASDMPLVGLLGALALAGALGLRSLR